MIGSERRSQSMACLESRRQILAILLSPANLKKLENVYQFRRFKNIVFRVTHFARVWLLNIYKLLEFWTGNCKVCN